MRDVANDEGLRLTAYKCPSGVWTIGYGHTAGVREGMTITHRQALRLLAADMSQAHAAVERHVKVPLRPKQKDALASFTFNVGEGAFAQSSVVRHVNNGDMVAAAKALLLYVHDANGRKLAGLEKRRIREVMALGG